MVRVKQRGMGRKLGEARLKPAPSTANESRWGCTYCDKSYDKPLESAKCCFNKFPDPIVMW